MALNIIASTFHTMLCDERLLAAASSLTNPYRDDAFLIQLLTNRGQTKLTGSFLNVKGEQTDVYFGTNRKRMAESMLFEMTRSAWWGIYSKALTKDRQTALKQCYTTDHMYGPG